MNILFTCHHRLSKNAGASKIYLDLIQEAKKTKNHVSIISLDHFPAKSQKIRSLLFRFSKVIFPVYVAYYYFFKQKKTDVIECCSFDGAVLFPVIFVLKKIFPKKSLPLLVNSSVGLEQIYFVVNMRLKKNKFEKIKAKIFSRVTFVLVCISMKFSDLVFFLNSTDHRYAKYHKILAQNKNSFTIPHGLSPRMLKKNENKQKNPKSIFFIGSFDARKGAHLLNKICLIINKNIPDFTLTMIGTLKKNEDVVNKFDQSIQNNIRNVPFYENSRLNLLLKKGSILLFPSIAEGFGIALLEGMASGLAPIAFKTGGPKDILKGGPDLVSVPSRNIEKYCQNVVSLVKNNGKLLKTQNWARKRAKTLTLKKTWCHRERIIKKSLMIYL